MNYAKMTVDQLREIATERELPIPKNRKKADLIAILKESDEGVQSVEAEVIEDQNGLAVSLVPGKLHADLSGLYKKIADIMAPFEDWEPTGDDPEELKEISLTRKYFSGIKREIEEKRKSIKREYLRPLDELEAMLGKATDKLQAGIDRLQAIEKKKDEERRIEEENKLREHYEAVAGLLADVVPYDKIADPKWLNKTVNIQKAKQELEDRCRKIAADWETLKGLNLAFADEAELRFFEMLDLGDATSYATKLAEDKARLEVMKAEREAYMQPEPAPAPVMMPVPGLTLESAPVMQPVPYSEPQPVMEPYAQPVPVTNERETLMQQIEAALEKYEIKQLNNLAEGLEAGLKERRGLMEPRLMVIEAATIDQLQAIGKICGMFGVTGAFQSGLLAQNLVNEMKNKRGQA